MILTCCESVARSCHANVEVQRTLIRKDRGIVCLGQALHKGLDSGGFGQDLGAMDDYQRLFTLRGG